MVERFNKTLATMLTGYVNEYHSNWDVLLPYVMMAYRSAEHETTGYTPNRLMLGREVSTPLDIIYELPNQVKPIPQNQWAWELQDKLESAHQIVQKYVSGQIMRQKKNHDKNVKWCQFKQGENVYVHFPLRAPGRSPKFTSQWWGPYQVLKKITDVTYEVDCGRGTRKQVIHADRMRPCPEQVLRGEMGVPSGSEVVGERCGKAERERSEDESLVDTPDLDIDDASETHVERHGRHKRPPAWLSDYVTDNQRW